MKNRKSNLSFFGKSFLSKREEPKTNEENLFVQNWYARHSDIFEDEHKRYFAMTIINIMYYRDGWLQLADQENFLELFFAEAEKRINRVFKKSKGLKNRCIKKI